MTQEAVYLSLFMNGLFVGSSSKMSLFKMSLFKNEALFLRGLFFNRKNIQ